MYHPGYHWEFRGPCDEGSDGTISAENINGIHCSNYIYHIPPGDLSLRSTHKGVQPCMDLMQPRKPQLLQKPLVMSASAAGHRSQLLEGIKEKKMAL